MSDTTLFNAAIKTIFEEDIIPAAMGKSLFYRFASKSGVPMHGGKTIQWARLLNSTKTTTASTEGTRISMGDASIKKFDADILTANPSWFDAVWELSREADILSYITQQDIRQNITNQHRRSMDYIVGKTVHDEGTWKRSDGDATLEKDGVTPSGTPTATVVQTNLTEANAFWDNSQVTSYLSTAPGYDEARNVASYLLASGQLTFSAPGWSNLLTTASRLWISSKSGIVAGDTFTVPSLLQIASMLSVAEAEKYPGGIYVGIIHPWQKRDFMADAATGGFSDLIKSNDRAAAFQNYETLRWYDIVMYIDTETVRTSTANAEDQAGGAVFCAPFFGSGAYDVYNYGEPNTKSGDAPGVQVAVIDDRDAYNLTGAKKHIAWTTAIAKRVLRASHVINLNTGATKVGWGSVTV